MRGSASLMRLTMSIVDAPPFFSAGQQRAAFPVVPHDVGLHA